MPKSRRQIIYEGRVQGVGFRMTARRLASAFPVAGFVRNREDGSVELAAEGEAEQVVAFLDAIRREFGDQIESTREFPGDPTDEFSSGFTIRY
jgi:acylphosphatase